jgi:hypothetical protein
MSALAFGGSVVGGDDTGSRDGNYWHFPSHDIPGAARAKKENSKWKWVDTTDATAVAGSQLSVLYRASKEGPLYSSTKSLAAADRCAALDGITLFNDAKLGLSRQQLLVQFDVCTPSFYFP